jgi:hypothetical protein
MSYRIRETTTFGEVPMSVIMPPNNDPNDIGISKRDTGTPLRLEI